MSLKPIDQEAEADEKKRAVSPPVREDPRVSVLALRSSALAAVRLYDRIRGEPDTRFGTTRSLASGVSTYVYSLTVSSIVLTSVALNPPHSGPTYATTLIPYFRLPMSATAPGPLPQSGRTYYAHLINN